MTFTSTSSGNVSATSTTSHVFVGGSAAAGAPIDLVGDGSASFNATGAVLIATNGDLTSLARLFLCQVL